MDVGAWLRQLGLERYEQAFRDNDIEAHLLPTLTADDLRVIGVVSLGHRKQLLAAIADLKAGAEPDEDATPPTAPPAKLHAERRQLTILFADLVGSTGLSSRLDPEEMREVLHSYHDVVTGIIARLGGYVSRLMGDGVLAYFGWPQADESEAERAVQAGLTVVEAVAGLASPNGEPLAARVGIASGLVVVGDLVGKGAAREEPVIGETPNLAARLQEAAPPGAVMIAPATRRLVGEMFELREVGPIKLKGFQRPLTGFQVLSERASESRFTVLRSSQPLPMVGRDQELALLVERWRQAMTGEGQAVLLVGEPGIGKSRLLQAALDAVAGEDQTVLRFQCSPYHAGTALWPLSQQLAAAAGIATGDNGLQKLNKIQALLLRIGVDVAAAVPFLAPLLGIEPGSGCQLSHLTPVQQRARTISVLIEYLLGFSPGGPLLIAIEDVHWIDPTSLELIDQALDRISDACVLMLLTSRPDSQPTLGGHPHVMRLTLNRLGRASAEAIAAETIAAQLSGDKGIPADLLDEIVARTDGVPLFIEELTKAVIETGMEGAGSVIPSSLHASLMARLDRVPGVKEVSQLAACIGREFDYPLLAAVSPFPESELLPALNRLVTAELVFRRGTPPEATYSFKHALVRDAAHECLLKPQRQQIHATIAQAIESRQPEVADSEPEVLAQHYAEARIADRAVDFWHRAGRQALARSAVAEAVFHLNMGLKLLLDLPSGPDRQRRELGLQLALGQASIAARGFAAAETGQAYGRPAIFAVSWAIPMRSTPCFTASRCFTSSTASWERRRNLRASCYGSALSGATLPRKSPVTE
jgi:class 3 adenylate cyclase